MLQASEDERDHSPMRSALVEGGPEVQMLFVKRRGQLKVRPRVSCEFSGAGA